jgi:NADH-quinone oxidoreductase subunit G
MYFDADPREQTAFRNRPRENEDVNKYWMCDDGMLTYQQVHANRILRATVGRGAEAKEVPLSEALTRAASDLAKAGGKLAVVLAATHSTEDNLVLADLAMAAGATLYLAARPPWDADKILRHVDNNPNRAGALQAAGAESLKGLRDLAAEVENHQAILALGNVADVDEATLAPLGRVGTFVLLASNAGPLTRHATVVIPVTTWAEADGSFVNAKGISQAFQRGLAPKGDSLPAWEAAARIGRAMKLDVAYKRFAEVRGALVSRTGVTPTRGKIDMSMDPATRTPHTGV